jgi:phosphatidylglycerol:prolipoprotein diacylglycerol transferase
VIEFPGLGIPQIPLKREAVVNLFGIENFNIYWYGIIIAFGFALAVLLAIKRSKRFDIEPDVILDGVLFAAPAAIIGARLYYVIFSWDLYKDNPIDIINIRKGGLAIYGGIIAAILVAWIYLRAKKIPPLKVIDFIVPYIALGQAIGRWGNFFNQEAFGYKTTVPWRMNGDIINQYLTGIDPAVDLKTWGVHPTFLYESILNFAIFFFLAWFIKKKKKDGEVLCLYMTFYGIGRFFIEGLRTDSLMLWLSGIRVSQFLAALFAIIFGIGFILLRRSGRALIEEVEPEGESAYSNILASLKSEEEAAAGGEESETDVVAGHGEDYVVVHGEENGTGNAQENDAGHGKESGTETGEIGG